MKVCLLSKRKVESKVRGMKVAPTLFILAVVSLLCLSAAAESDSDVPTEEGNQKVVDSEQRELNPSRGFPEDIKYEKNSICLLFVVLFSFHSALLVYVFLPTVCS